MELNYNVRIKQTENNELKNNLKYTSPLLDLKTFKVDGEFVITSNSENVGEYFENSSEVVSSINKNGNFIVGYNENPNSFVDLNINSNYISDLKTSKYNSKLIPIIDLEFEVDIEEEDDVTLLVYDELIHDFSLVLKEDYDIDLENQKIISISLDLSKNYFFVLKKEYLKYKKTVPNFRLKNEDLLNTSDGFYQILPSYKNKTLDYNLRIENNTFNLISKKPLKLYSDLNINYDNCVTNSFNYIPNFQIEISYGMTDYTLLKNIESFDPLKEYIIFELRNNIQVPKYFLSSENTDLDSRIDFDLLIQSHEEFKKPFSIISSKAELDIFNSEQIKIKTQTIVNKDFNRIKNDEAFATSLTKIKI